jgi:hypothetical protein
VIPSETVVDRPLELRVEVMHPTWARPRWEPPHFEGFWPERLSTQGETIGANPVSLRRTVFRRALFPSRAGRLQIALSTLRYEEPDGTERVLPVPGAFVRVDPLPQEGRPPGFAGVVGQVEMQTSVTPNPVVRGESARLILEVYGRANLWNLESPSLGDEVASVFEVFAGRPRLHVGEHEGRITVRRTFVWDLVPRREGRLDIPTPEIPYFSPERGQYRVVRSEPLSLEVVKSAAHLEDRSPFAASAGTARRGWSGVRAVLIWVLACGATVLFLMRWARRNAERLRRPSRPSPKAALAAARESLGTQEFPKLLGRAVRAGIATRHRIDVEGLTTEEIAARVDDPDAVEILETVDRIRFARAPTPPESLLPDVVHYLGEAHDR